MHYNGQSDRDPGLVRREGGGEVITELKPAPEEAIDVLERLERLEEENREIRRDLREAKIFSMKSKIDDLWDWVTEIDKKTINPIQPKQRNRREQLVALLLKNDGKMMASNARTIMNMPKNQFSQLLKQSKDIVEVKPFHADRRLHVIKLIKK